MTRLDPAFEDETKVRDPDHPLDYRASLLASPMSRFQTRAVVLCILLSALDGFDIFAITFAAPAIERELGIGKAALGFVFSAGLIGMAAGSLILAPLADLFGRRRLIIPSLLMMVSGTAWSAVAGGLFDLGASRALTGLGVGAMISVIHPLVAEYANAKRRDPAITLLSLGFPIGGVLGGLIAAFMIPAFGWRSVFLTASVLGGVMLALVIAWLPEAVTGLLARRRPETLTRVNAYLARCGQPALPALPPLPDQARRPAGLLFGRGARGNTVRITAVYFLFILSVFYIQSWVPSLVVSAGFGIAQAASVGVWMNVAGIIGGLAMGALVSRYGLVSMVIVAFLATASTIALFGIVPATLVRLTAMAVAMGFFTIGGTAILFALISRSFPAEARASGTGIVIGLGRFGSAASPAIAGLLFAAGIERAGVSVLMAAPALFAALILIWGRVGQYD